MKVVMIITAFDLYTPTKTMTRILTQFPHSATTRDSEFVKMAHKAKRGDTYLSVWKRPEVIQLSKTTINGENYALPAIRVRRRRGNV